MTAKVEPLLGTAREWAIDLAVATAVGVFLGLVGPYGSYFNGPLAPRIFHFVVCFWVGTLIFGLSHRLAAAWAQRAGVPVWAALVGAMLVGCGPLSVFVGWLATLLWPFLKGRFTALDWYGQCLILSVPVLAYGLLRRELTARAGQPRPPPPIEPMRPTPEAASGRVLCLRMEDHYVRVHTAAGSRLVTGPFERVIAGLGEVEGMRVHRSWWVARAAVIGVVADGRNLRLALEADLSAPVSRASVARLRAAGWLAPETGGEI
jgi:hypothetical protein